MNCAIQKEIFFAKRGFAEPHTVVVKLLGNNYIDIRMGNSGRQKVFLAPIDWRKRGCDHCLRLKVAENKNPVLE
jgi:hypothetical protein